MQSQHAFKVQRPFCQQRASSQRNESELYRYALSMRRAAEDLNELLIGNALPTMACCSRQLPNLSPDSWMLKIRRMNADPNQWSASQSERQATIPCQARHRPPTSARSPNKGLRW